MALGISHLNLINSQLFVDNDSVLQSLPAVRRDFVKEGREMALSEKTCVSATFGKSWLTHGSQNNWSPPAFQRPGGSRERKKSSVIHQPRDQAKTLSLPGKNHLKNT